MMCVYIFVYMHIKAESVFVNRVRLIYVRQKDNIHNFVMIALLCWWSKNMSIIISLYSYTYVVDNWDYYVFCSGRPRRPERVALLIFNMYMCGMFDVRSFDFSSACSKVMKSFILCVVNYVFLLAIFS